MPYDPNDSGEYIRPLPQYLDNLIVEHPVIGTCELWKAIAWDTAQLRNYKLKRADSAASIAEEAQKGAPGQPRLAPPLVADAASKDKDEASVMEKIYQALDDLETRLGVLEERKRQQQEEAECARRAEAALALAEEIAESAPSSILDGLPLAPQQRLN
jgi:hypothetical protein